MDDKPLRVLLVEDNPGDALLVQEALEESDRFELVHAERLGGGLEVIRSGGVDAVLLDLSLPDGRGLDSFRVMRSAAPHLPIVVLSGLGDEETAVTVVAEGAQDYLVKGPTIRALLTRALRYAVHRKQLEAELKRCNAQLAELAVRDELTGLYNSRHLHEALTAVSSLATRTQRPFSVVMMDVDRFKLYNDEFGHLAGDEVLREVGAILRSLTRAHDLAARYGGEEFAVLLPATGLEAVLVFAERVRAAFASAPWPLRSITASFGVATSQADVADGETLLSQADDALYRAKRAGRNRVVHHDDPPHSGRSAPLSSMTKEPHTADRQGFPAGRAELCLDARLGELSRVTEVL